MVGHGLSRDQRLVMESMDRAGADALIQPLDLCIYVSTSCGMVVASKELNDLVMRRELPGRSELDRYRSKKRQYHIYRAAAKLWCKGVPLQDALKIITEAFEASTYE